MSDLQQPPISARERARAYDAQAQEARDRLQTLHDDRVSIESQPDVPVSPVAIAIAIVAGVAALAYVSWGLLSVYVLK